MFNFSVSFHQENAKWSNINVFCDISENIVYKGKIHMTSKVNGLDLLPLFNISVVGPKVLSSLRTTLHETFSF